MPALQFFLVFSEAQKIEERKRALDFISLTDIASISIGDAKYYELIRGEFMKPFKRSVNRDCLDPTDPLVVAQIESLTMQATRLQS